MAGVFSVVAGVVVSDGEHSQFFPFVSIRGFQKVAVESDGQWGRRGKVAVIHGKLYGVDTKRRCSLA